MDGIINNFILISYFCCICKSLTDFIESKHFLCLKCSFSKILFLILCH